MQIIWELGKATLSKSVKKVKKSSLKKHVEIEEPEMALALVEGQLTNANGHVQSSEVPSID
jgi:hypothetical protein